MGFESNNPLHGDWPAHWHLIYYWPPPAEPGKGRYHGSQVPHFYMNEKGRTVSNSIHVFGSQGRLAKAGDPMIFTDPNGKVRLAIDIRRDGGVDIGPAAGQWTYSIVAGDDEGRFTESVRVLRRGRPWVRVAARDDTAAGVMTLRVEPLGRIWTYEWITREVSIDTGGRDVPVSRLAVGAGPVLSCYEFKHPMRDRLTDEKRRAMLRSDKAPRRPEWVKSYLRE